MSTISAALSESSEPVTSIWVDIPTGYVPLPTDNIRENMAVAADVVSEQASEQQQPTAQALITMLTSYLEGLAASNGLYCGVGHHLSAIDGSALTSSLVVALQEYPEKVNPRVLLKDVLVTKSAAGDRGQADLVDVDGRPMLFFETDRTLPTPRFPGQVEIADEQTSTVYQLEALIPADDGSKLVSIEFSTPFVSHGPEFRAMVVIMAASVSFDQPMSSPAGAGDGGTGHVISDVLHG